MTTSILQTNYPVTSTVALTHNLASLASDTNLLAGRASTAVDNTANQDVDHQVSGVIKTGTTPTVSTTIELWVYAFRSLAAGTPTYPDSITGADANKTMTSANVKYAGMKLAASITVDATSNRDYDIALFSVAWLFGYMPQFWGIFAVHNTGAALNAAQVALNYNRIRQQIS